MRNHHLSFLNHDNIIRGIAALATFIAIGGVLIFSPSELQYPAALKLIRLAEIVDALLLAAMFYAAIGLLTGRRMAWVMAVCILISSSVWESIQSKYIISWLSIFILLTLIVVLSTHTYYMALTEKGAIWYATRRALLFTIITTIIGCLGAYILSMADHMHFGLGDSIIKSLDHMYALRSIADPMPHPTPPHIIGRLVLFILGIVNYIVIALALLKPLVDNFTLTPSTHQHVLQLLNKYGKTAEGYFKFFPDDKSYFFSKHVEGFIAYGMSGGICVGLADPIAKNNHDRHQLLDEFMRFTRSQGWQTCFLSVTEDQLGLYEQHRLTASKIGHHAIVSTDQFVATTVRNKHFRSINNRFTKQGYKAKILVPPHSEAVMDELKIISDEWLKRGRRKERRFVMGFFDKSYLQQCKLFVVYDHEKHIQAFVNLPPSYSRKRVTFDLLRYSDQAPRDINAFLFLSLIRYLHSIDYAEFDMGLAPLSGLEASRSLDERGMHMLYKYTKRWFAFKGLRDFKNKFSPTWEARYIVYKGNSSQALSVAIELGRLMKYNRDKNSQKNRNKEQTS